MAISSEVRPWVARYLNPIPRRIAAWLPGFCVATYVGRTSGRTYTTPLNVFRRDGRYVFALTYGPDVQWVKNVLAAGRCEIVSRGRRFVLLTPGLVQAPGGGAIPIPARQSLLRMGVDQFLGMDPESPRPAPPA